MERDFEACYGSGDVQPLDHAASPLFVDADHRRSPQIASGLCTMADAPRRVQAGCDPAAASIGGIVWSRRMLKGQDRAGGAVTAAADFGTRLLDLASQLAHLSELPDGLMCTYYSPAHKAAAAQLHDWMQAAGLHAEIDAVGDVIGRYAAADPAARTLIVGSHYDTVANAGQFDGRLGILTGLVVAEHLRK